MKIKYLLFSLAFSAYTLHAQEWPQINGEAYPAARWWWLGSAVDKENLTYNLEQYAKAGLRGVEITPIYGVQNNDKNNIPFLSKKWMEILQYTLDEGKRLGVEIDMNTGTGWPFGGPNVKIEDAATKALFQCYNIKGGESISLNIEVDDAKQKGIAILSKVMAYNDKKKSLDITSFANDGKLYWKAPKGDWQIIVLYIGKTLQKVKRAAPGGEGYVMNHFDKRAVKSYLKNFDIAFKESNSEYPHTFFNDSYEVYGADWTPDFLKEFYKRRGYKLEQYFPEFISKNRDDITARIICDYRETISDLLIENFTSQWSEWAHSNGSITRNQAHGSPSNLVDTYAAVDIPECEGFGLSQFNIKGLRSDSLTRKNDSDLSMLKYASSAAHITGKKFTSSETFTWLTEHFRTSLSQCKPDMDLMFISGVNHMFFHGTAYSPKDAKWPGWKFYASIDMSPTNSIWRDAPSFFDYITKCQSFLQMGTPDNDMLVYLPVYDIWQEQPGRLLQFSIHDMEKQAPKFIKSVNTIVKCGYDVDYISDKYIMSMKCEDGKLVTTGGTAYKAIIIPAVKFMPPKVLQQLTNLAEKGATIIFLENYPDNVPGFNKWAQRKSEFDIIKKQLPDVPFNKTINSDCGKGKIITGTDYFSVLNQSGIPSEEMNRKYGLQYIRRKNENGHHYFISSLQNKGFDGWLTLSVNETEAMLFNPMNGEKGKAATIVEDGKTKLYLQLKSGESIIAQTFNKPLNNVESWKYLEEQSEVQLLDHGWKLQFKDSQPAIEGVFNIDTPTSWTELDNKSAKINMASASYTNRISLPEITADDWIIDLGDVRESAKVLINDNYVGTVWAAPYRIKVGKWLLHKGENKIEIIVTNLPANRISNMDKRGEKWRIFNEINVVNINYKDVTYKDWQPMLSGLNSVVRLIPIKYK